MRCIDAKAAEFRAVTSTNGMTADFYHFDMEFLAHVSNRIINEVIISYKQIDEVRFSLLMTS